MIVAVKETLDVALNHNQKGKITTDEYNRLLYMVLQNVYQSLFSDNRKMLYRKMRFQDTPNYGDESFYLKQAQEFYIDEKSVNVSEGGVDLQNEVREMYLLNKAFTNTTEIEKVDVAKFASLSRHPEYKPNECSPICAYHGGTLKVSPKEIKKIDVVYFRKIKPPKLTSDILDGEEIYDVNATDFQDIDVHPIMLHAVFIELLLYFGLNLKEEYAMQLAQQMKQEEQMKQQ